MENNRSVAALFTSAEQMAGADNYNDWTFNLFRPYLRGRVLEVGCGVGSFTKRIIQRGSFRRLLCVDTSLDAINYCRTNFTHPSLEFQCIDVQEVQGEFDLIICMNVLEHIKEHEKAFSHLWEMLSSKGTLFLLVPAHQFLFNQFDKEGGHFRRYDKQSLQKLISQVALGENWRIEQYYFNIMGALGYWFVYKVLRADPQTGGNSEVGIFDKFVVPIMRKLEGKHMPFGISLITILTKG